MDDDYISKVSTNQKKQNTSKSHARVSSPKSHDKFKVKNTNSQGTSLSQKNSELPIDFTAMAAEPANRSSSGTINTESPQQLLAKKSSKQTKRTTKTIPSNTQPIVAPTPIPYGQRPQFRNQMYANNLSSYQTFINERLTGIPSQQYQSISTQQPQLIVPSSISPHNSMMHYDSIRALMYPNNQPLYNSSQQSYMTSQQSFYSRLSNTGSQLSIPISTLDANKNFYAPKKQKSLEMEEIFCDQFIDYEATPNKFFDKDYQDPATILNQAYDSLKYQCASSEKLVPLIVNDIENKNDWVSAIFVCRMELESVLTLPFSNVQTAGKRKRTYDESTEINLFSESLCKWESSLKSPEVSII